MSAPAKDPLITMLRTLIESCRTSVRSFDGAAERLTSAGLRTLFGGYARQRLQFGDELDCELRRLGDSGSPSDETLGSYASPWAGAPERPSARETSVVSPDTMKLLISTLSNG